MKPPEKEKLSQQEVDNIIPDGAIKAWKKVVVKDDGEYFSSNNLEDILQEIGKALSDGGLL